MLVLWKVVMVIYMQHSSTFQSVSKWWVLASPLDLAQMKSLPIGVVPRPLLTTVKGNTHTHTVFSVFPSINKKRCKSTGQNCVWVFVSKIEKLKGAVITINISQKRRGTMLVLSFFFLIYSAVIGGGDGGGNTAETSADDKCKCEKTERQWKMHLSSYLSHYHHRRRHHHRYCSSSGRQKKRKNRQKQKLVIDINCQLLKTVTAVSHCQCWHTKEHGVSISFHFVLITFSSNFEPRQ